MSVSVYENPLFKEFILLLERGVFDNSKEINELLPKLIQVVRPDEIVKICGLSQTLLHTLVGFTEIEYELLFQNKGQIINCNVPNANGISPLHEACMGGDERGAKLLLDHGAQVDFVCNDSGYTPLEMLCMHCSYEYHSNLYHLLVESGADLNRKNEEGENILHTACERNDLDFALLLIKSGSDYNLKDIYGQRPIDLMTDPGLKRQLLEFIETRIESR